MYGDQQGQAPLLDQGSGYPPPGPPQGYPPQGGPPQGYPPQEGGYPPGPPQGYPPQGGGGYPPQDGGGYPPPGPPGGGYPPDMGGAYPPQQGMNMYGGGAPEDVLANAGMIAIKQKVSLLEAAGDLASSVPCAEACCEKENEYEVYDQSHGQAIFYAKENSEMFGLTARCCCNPAHELTLEISQAKGQPVIFTVQRPFKCCQGCPAWIDMCQQEMTLTNTQGQILGAAKQPCCGGFFSPKVDVMEDNVDGSPFASINGPCCCFGGLTEMVCDQKFEVKDPNDSNIGQITKEKPEGMAQAITELMTDSDLFTVRFPPQMASKQKMLLLATTLLLDYMFFEQNKPWECDPIEQSLSCTCCSTYMCGSYQPCTCKCGGAGGEGE